MYALPSALFPRQLSFTSLLDLSEKYNAAAPSPRREVPKRPRIAIVGAGVTGVATACHILDAGFECHIFEARGPDSVGGIWARVNDTSTLQIDSRFYRFHPAVTWQSHYPNRREILGQVSKLWEQYGLSQRASFHCDVTSVFRKADKWVVNDASLGLFDGLVAAVGTCGDMYAPAISGQDIFKGAILHSSQLEKTAIKNKRVLIVGGGASAVEALEFACDNGATSAKVLARSERWFIPRHPKLNACLAALIGDRFGLLARFVEFLLRLLFYRELSAMAPHQSSDGIFSGTPIVNSRLFELMRQGRASWQRGDVQQFTPDGIEFSHRLGGAPKGSIGESKTEDGEVCILATGYKRPSLDFLPKPNSKARYQPPNWYLQVFPTEDATICATNCTWRDGIGSVGGGHIGIYTRFLLVFLLDPRARPSPRMMQAWVDLVHLLKAPCAGGALAFVTSMELFLWFLIVIVVQPVLWKWMRFILLGPDVQPSRTDRQEQRRKQLAPHGQKRWPPLVSTTEKTCFESSVCQVL